MQTATRTREPTLMFLSGTRPLPVEPRLGDAPALHAYGVTHEGNVRGSNEDQFLVAQTDRVVRVDWSSFEMERGSGWPVDRHAKILMVADGLGGHAQGELASAVVVDAMLDAVASIRALPGEADLGALLRASVERAQQRVLEVAERKALHFKPATTLTMAYVS
ncbi:MAG: protein phosphatase 2C domain-containing protein, partial [Myxococcales bacterium]|nr:protein phosphatase 2C domain-containing protein [Myxococcales bacterium]